MSGTEKVLIIGAITALAVVLALARREPPGPLAVAKGRPGQGEADRALEFPAIDIETGKRAPLRRAG